MPIRHRNATAALRNSGSDPDPVAHLTAEGEGVKKKKKKREKRRKKGSISKVR